MKRGTAIKSNLLWFDRRDILAHWPRITSKLTSRSKYEEDDTDTEIQTWLESGDMIGLPVVYGKIVADYLKLTIKDETVLGHEVSYPSRPTPRTAKQRQFFDSLSETTRRDFTVLSVAPTGTGKTVAGLNMIADISRAGLVIVPSKNLAKQWKDEAMLHLGLTTEEVHVFQGGDCKWEGCSIVIAVIHNLCDRVWPRGFYQHFGVVVWDEGHRVGAKVFSQSLSQFPARYRVALTATPNRKDGRTSILHHAFGEPNRAVKGTKMRALDCDAYVVNTRSKVRSPSWGNTMMKMGKLISGLAADTDRNTLVADIIARGYAAGRVVLGIGDRVAQLKEIKKILVTDHDMPAGDIGLFIGAATEKVLESIKSDCSVILATYGMMKEGQDVPRLDMGIDITPRSDGVQAIGRIRREEANKKPPIWVTLYDESGCELCKRISRARIKDYEGCGVKVIKVYYSYDSIPF